MEETHNSVVHGADLSRAPTTSPRTVRVRSRVACQECNRRKIRCNVANGLPCSNCKHDDKACQVVPRKKHR